MIKFKVITPRKGALERQVMEAIKRGIRSKLTGVLPRAPSAANCDSGRLHQCPRHPA